MADRTVSPEIPSAVPMSRELWLQPVPETDSDFLGDTAQSDQFDLRAIWPTIFRNRWWLFAIMAAATGLGIASIMLTQPTYRATSSILIDQKTVKILGTEDADPLVSGNDREAFLQTQVDILKSRGQALKVVDKLKLGSDEAFMTSLNLRPEQLARISAEDRRTKAMEALTEDLRVTLQRNSRVVKLSFDNHDPIQAARIANTYGDVFIAGNLQRKFDTTAYSRKFLSEQLAQTRSKLENSERALASYARTSGLVDVAVAQNDGKGGSTSQSLTATDLGAINQSRTAAKTQRIAAEQQWRQAQATPLLNIPEVLADPGVAQLSQALALAQVDFSDLREKLKAGHPTVQQAIAKIDQLRTQIEKRAASIKDSIRQRYQIALRQEQAFSTNVSVLKDATMDERDRSIQYNFFKRDVDTNRELYDALLQRFKEVSAEAGVTTNNISIVDSADPPRVPIAPVPLKNMLYALLVGLAAAAAWIYMRERLIQTVLTPDDVKSKVGMSLLGVMPLLADGIDPKVALLEPKSSISEAVHALRASMELSSRDGLPKSLALTSARASEGKSTLAYALGHEFSTMGRRIVIVDGDMRAPSQHRNFGRKNDIGLSQLLARQVEVADCLTKTDFEGLDLITSGPVPPDPTLLLGGNRMAEVIQHLQGQYELVIIDCPPVLGLADAIQIGSNVEAVIVVIEANDTSLHGLRTGLRRLKEAYVPVIGAVLSKFDAAGFGYGAEYGYYYSRYEDHNRNKTFFNRMKKRFS
jgi:succinoglycan biosynthesis transport protein ExoP